MDVINFLFSPRVDFIRHLCLSIYLILYYGMEILNRLNEKRRNIKYSSSYKSLVKGIGYYYIILETIFLILDGRIYGVNYVSVVIHIVSVCIILIAMLLLRRN